MIIQKDVNAVYLICDCAMCRASPTWSRQQMIFLSKYDKNKSMKKNFLDAARTAGWRIISMTKCIAPGHSLNTIEAYIDSDYSSPNKRQSVKKGIADYER